MSRRVKLLSMNPTNEPPPPRHPRDFLDSTAGYADAFFQRLFVNRVDYDSTSWDETVREVEKTLGGNAAKVLSEPALEKAESDVRNLLADIPPDEGFHKKWAADSLLARFSYLACRLVKPEVAVESGVAYGVSSAFILAAMEENGWGRLHSVDLRPLRRNTRRFHAIAVPEKSKERWSFHPGSSRRILPKLFSEIGGGEIDFFLHDSLHTLRNMRFEFDEIWPRLRSGGLIVADDVERNGAFGELKKKEPSLWRVVRDRETHSLHGNKAPVTFGVVVK
ncbi:MAG: class I SAM-dependent methyltransferase [Rubrobacteraceae bacterium]